MAAKRKDRSKEGSQALTTRDLPDTPMGLKTGPCGSIKIIPPPGLIRERVSTPGISPISPIDPQKGVFMLDIFLL
jgi:hypothetical protein